MKVGGFDQHLYNKKGGHLTKHAKLILKDLSIAKQMAKKISLNIFMGKKAFDLYNSFCRKDKNNLDYSAIIKSLFKNK